MKKSLLSLFTFLLIIKIALAQSPSDAFQLSNINLPYLEHVVKIKIDEFRKSKDLNPLYNDSILYVAAKDHAQFLVKTKRISHYQRDDIQKEYPQNRAVFHGASEHYEVLENIAKTTVLQPVTYKHERQQKKPKTHISDTYEMATKDIIISWLYDKEDKERLLTENLEVVGVAIELDPQRSQLKTVVKFAHIRWQYQFKEYPHLFKYARPLNLPYVSSFRQVKSKQKTTDNEWNLTGIKNQKTCERCKVGRELHTSVWFEQDERDNIYVLTDDTEWATSVFKNPTDGVALEIVKYASFDCGNPDFYTMPSRRNGLSLFNGQVLEPVYTQDILAFQIKKEAQFEARRAAKIAEYEKAYKKAKHPSRVERIEKRLAEWKTKVFDPPPLRFKIGRLPREIQGYYALNLLLIQEQQICRVVHFTGYCGESYKNIQPIEYQHSLNKNRPSVKYTTHIKTQDLTFTIPFKKNEFDFTYNDIRPFVEALTSEKFTAKEIYIEAFTSIEGDPKINQRLQHRRANSIIEAILSQQVDKSVIKKIDAKANWNLFYQQIQNTEFSRWANWEKDDIVDVFLDDHLEAKFEPYLSEQRKAIVRMKVEIKVKTAQSSSINFSLRGFQDALTNTQLENGQINLEQLELAEMIQDQLFQQVKKKKLSPTIIQKMTIPNQSFFMNLLNNQIYIELYLNQHLGKKGEQFFPKERIYNKLYLYTKLDNPDPKLVFNHAAFLINHWQKQWLGGRLRPIDIYDDIRSLAASPLSPELVDKLWLNYHFNAVFHYQNIRGTESREHLIFSLESIYYHFQDKKITSTQALKLAKLFIWAETPTYATSMLESFATQARPNTAVLSLYLKLTFRHIEEYPKSDYFNQLKAAKKVLSQKEWCNLFIGECRISFQVFDQEALRNLYCKTCGGLKNYGRTY